MEPKIGLNVLYTDFEGNTRAAVVTGVLEQTEDEDKRDKDDRARGVQAEKDAGIKGAEVKVELEVEGKVKKQRVFTLAQLSVFGAGGGLTSIGAEFNRTGKPGTWMVGEGDGPKLKAEKLEPDPEAKSKADKPK